MDIQESVEDAKRLAVSKKDARLRPINGMNHVLKRVTTPVEQQASYFDPSMLSAE